MGLQIHLQEVGMQRQRHSAIPLLKKMTHRRLEWVFTPSRFVCSWKVASWWFVGFERLDRAAGY